MTILESSFIVYAFMLMAFCVPGVAGIYHKRGISGKMFKIFIVGLVVLIVFGIVVATQATNK